MAAPSFPDIQQGTVALLKSKPSIEAPQIGTFQTRTPRYPLVTVEHDGSRMTDDTRVEEARLICTVEAKTEQIARKVAYQIRDVFLPPDAQVDGLHETVDYVDEETAGTRTVHFSGSRLESGPRVAPDGPNRVIVAFLVQYW